MSSIDLDHKSNLLKKFLLISRRLLPKARSYAEFISEVEVYGFTPKLRDTLLRTPIEADLHLHSYHSDGQLAPEHLVWLGKILGLKCIALVDHDNISGLNVFVEEGKKLGLPVWAGVELKTATPGCEILFYIPDAEAFLAYLKTPNAEKFRAELMERQKKAHEQTALAKDELNFLLKDWGKTDLISDAEIGRWYSGVSPFYPGTLCVLFLNRLTEKDREKLGVRTPRDINIKYLTPILEKWENKLHDNLESTFSLINEVKKESFTTYSVLAHPVELLRNAGMTNKEIEDFTLELALKYGLDGLEVNNPRDTTDELKIWSEIREKVDSKLKEKEVRFHAFTMSSDFHILDPSKAAGAFIMGFGLLDEEHPEGNLKSLETWSQFKAKMDID